MWLKWLPWRIVLSQVAKSHGFIDPVHLLSQLHRFAQPSEVTEPIELLRAGVLFHARGLINARTIQHNLDWVWPYWVERQFDPHDESFIPRAFSITHVNLTHRNWTAVGLPDCEQLPIVDPRGLITPHLDRWSLDAWVVLDDGTSFYPSRAPQASQQLTMEHNLVVKTSVRDDHCGVSSQAEVTVSHGTPVCRVQYSAEADRDGWFVVAVRPANPEGVSFIHEIHVENPRRWCINRQSELEFGCAPDRVCMSRYREGDVAINLQHLLTKKSKACDVGLLTAAAMFRMDSQMQLSVEVPLNHHPRWSAPLPRSDTSSRAWTDWPAALAGRCQLQTPDERLNHLFEVAVYNLVLHSPGEVYPGPYTYKRFWFRDAAFILNSLMAVNLTERAGRAIARFPRLQTSLGYFHSQDGEWDSNGAALWTINRYRVLSGRELSGPLRHAVEKGAAWIARKRVRMGSAEPHAGLLPAGFSAEHLGPNDYYYWDDFWSIAGLESAAAMATAAGQQTLARRWQEEAASLRAAVDRSLQRTAAGRDEPCIPASPYRRLDSGAIGSLAASYPLQIWAPDDERMQATVQFLMDNCLVQGGFFQDMIHSGINPYLTLHLAQVLLRSGTDHAQQYLQLMQTVAELASPTGQWPEAIHPQTHGGCMGDGQHLWAAAEWVMMVRNLFVREEGNSLILGSGLPRQWLRDNQVVRLGPTPTPYGLVDVEVTSEGDTWELRWDGEWRSEPAQLLVQLPGTESRKVQGETGCVALSGVRS